MASTSEQGLSQWGPSEHGLRLGLRAEPRESDRGTDVVAVVINESEEPHYLGGDFDLLVRSRDGRRSVVGGPRSGERIPITPGDEFEFASWRLSEETIEPGSYVCVLIYHPEKGSPVQSGEVAVSVESTASSETTP
jgi:hypothetical protein